MSEHRCEYNDVIIRITQVESSTASAHKRIDSVDGSNKKLWERVHDNEAKYMDAVPKAHSAYESVINLSATLDSLEKSIQALHRRNDAKDESDAVAYDKLSTKIDDILYRENAREIQEAERRGAEKLKSRMLSIFGAVALTMFISMFVYIFSTLQELKVHDASIDSKTKAILKHEKYLKDDKDEKDNE